MKTLLSALALCAVLTLALGAAERELAGNWIGAIDTTRGQMEIGLNLHVEKDKLVGVIKTAHGDWGVTRVVQKDGEWTVSFKGDGNEGQMIGRITDNTFAGKWKSMMADGTFELTRPKAKRAVNAPR